MIGFIGSQKPSNPCQKRERGEGREPCTYKSGWFTKAAPSTPGPSPPCRTRKLVRTLCEFQVFWDHPFENILAEGRIFNSAHKVRTSARTIEHTWGGVNLQFFSSIAIDLARTLAVSWCSRGPWRKTGWYLDGSIPRGRGCRPCRG